MDGEELSTERHNTELFSFIGALHVADSLSPCQSVAMAIKNLIQTRQLLVNSVLFPPHPSPFTPPHTPPVPTH